MRVLLEISYLGTNYHGWQVQPNGITVQEVLQSKIIQMYKTNVCLTGCSRTDAGVHAYQFFCHFDAPFYISENGIIKGLNAILPDDISILSATYVDDNFHSRYSANGKNYIYKIENSKIKNPFNSDRVWHIERELNIELMNKFLKAIVGTHDFSGFSASKRTTDDTVRTVSECFAKRSGDYIIVSITANGFLYNMVRIIVGTAVCVSDGKISVDDIQNVIDSKDRSKAGITAPPNGLYLNKVFY